MVLSELIWLKPLKVYFAFYFLCMMDAEVLSSTFDYIEINDKSSICFLRARLCSCVLAGKFSGVEIFLFVRLSEQYS